MQASRAFRCNKDIGAIRLVGPLRRPCALVQERMAEASETDGKFGRRKARQSDRIRGEEPCGERGLGAARREMLRPSRDGRASAETKLDLSSRDRRFTRPAVARGPSSAGGRGRDVGRECERRAGAAHCMTEGR